MFHFGTGIVSGRGLLLGCVLLCVSGQSALAAQPSPRAMEQLAADKGCPLCHRAKPGKAAPDSLLPFAPSWTDIAKKYKGRSDAESRLTAIVLGGSDPKHQHWYGKVSDLGMLPNVQQVDETQARQLVRWILSFAR
jgi:cytochrome c551/c552